MRPVWLYLLAGWCVSVKTLSAQVKLASLFTDNMVLQQQSKPAVWRRAAPNFFRHGKAVASTLEREQFGVLCCTNCPVQLRTTSAHQYRGKSNSACLRDAQRKAAASIPNTGMAVLWMQAKKRTFTPQQKSRRRTIGPVAIGKNLRPQRFWLRKPGIR